MAEPLDAWVRRLAAGRVRSTLAGGRPAWEAHLAPTKVARLSDDALAQARPVPDPVVVGTVEEQAARRFLQAQGLTVHEVGTHGVRIASCLARRDADGLRRLSSGLRARQLHLQTKEMDPTILTNAAMAIMALDRMIDLADRAAGLLVPASP